MSPGDSSEDPYVRISVELRQSTLVWLDDLRKEWGVRSRGDLVSRLLDELAKPTSIGDLQIQIIETTRF